MESTALDMSAFSSVKPEVDCAWTKLPKLKLKTQIGRDLKIFMETPVKAELRDQDYDVFPSRAIEKGSQPIPRHCRPFVVQTLDRSGKSTGSVLSEYWYGVPLLA
jgi:hypothetical protein